VRKREIERQRRKQRRAELRTSETWAKIQKGTREDRWGKSRSERKPDSGRKSVIKGRGKYRGEEKKDREDRALFFSSGAHLVSLRK